MNIIDWYKRKYPKCDFCGKSLFRFGNPYGGTDVKITSNTKVTAYLCNLCYKLFS
jgi:hypothetical protein